MSSKFASGMIYSIIRQDTNELSVAEIDPVDGNTQQEVFLDFINNDVNLIPHD